jgi:hypothetical protein
MRANEPEDPLRSAKRSRDALSRMFWPFELAGTDTSSSIVWARQGSTPGDARMYPPGRSGRAETGPRSGLILAS